MTQNKVMKLWTAIVTAFLTLCTALGFITTTAAAAAVPQDESTPNSATSATAPTIAPWTGPYSRALPPTMKQRIRAEAHGSSPSCRHRPPTDATAVATTDVTNADAAAPAALCAPEVLAKLQTPLQPASTPLRR